MGNGAGSLREYALYGQEAATRKIDVRQRSGDETIDAIGPNASIDTGIDIRAVARLRRCEHVRASTCT